MTCYLPEVLSFKTYQVIKNDVFRFQGIVTDPNSDKHNINENKNQDKQNKMKILHHLKKYTC